MTVVDEQSHHDGLFSGKFHLFSHILNVSVCFAIELWAKPGTFCFFNNLLYCCELVNTTIRCFLFSNFHNLVLLITIQRKQRPLPNGGRGFTMRHFFEKKFPKIYSFSIPIALSAISLVIPS